MKYDELCAALLSECEQGYDYVVELSYAYFSDTIGTFNECVSYEVFSVDSGNIIWFNDWFEGQDSCYYENPIKVVDLIRAYNITEQIKGLRGWPEDCYEQILKLFEKAGDPI